MKCINNYVFFWGGFLSQWQPADFIDAMGVAYNCAEQYMMAKKAAVMRDANTYNAIMKSTDPKEQKQLGRNITNFDATVWDQYKIGVVIAGNVLKFTQNDFLLRQLLQFKTETFVEASPYDKVWGIGKHVKDITEQDCDFKIWNGQNLLGYSLTMVRNFILKAPANSGLPAHFINSIDTSIMGL